MPVQVPQDMLGMDDAAFMNLNSPPVPAGEGTGDDADKATQQAADDAAAAALQQQQDEQAELDKQAAIDAENAKKADSQDQDDKAAADKNQQQADDGSVKQPDVTQKVDDKSKEVDTSTKDKSGENKDDSAKDDKSQKADDTPLDYENLYKKLMAPIKANGKTIEVRSPEEAIQLMQMGANYTRKMQAIAPHRKVLLMLENNGLLDEGKLSYLIDLDKKDPEAIKKLIKESGLDPLQIDVTSDKSTYQPGNHQVTDEEAAFVAVLEDVKSAPAGAETLRAINDEWDQASKEVLWRNPDLMNTIHEQRQNGVYALIASEVDRLRSLGSIPANIPFLQAYKTVGDKLDAEGKFAPLVQKQPEQQQPADKQPVVTRVQQPKPPVKNGDKAQAAAPSRSSAKKAEPFVNPLAMSDEEFSKQFSHRL